MPDREKVIAWLADEELYYREHGNSHNSLMACDAIALIEKQENAYQGAVELLRQKTILFDDAIKRLKEQEAVKPVLDEQTGRLWLCGNCGSYVGFEDNDPHDPNEFDKYCRQCGRPVLWESR